MASKYQSKLAAKNEELTEALEDASGYIEFLEDELETTQAKNEKLTEQVDGLAQFGAESFLLNLVQDQVIEDDRALLRRSMDAMREASTVITDYRDAEAAARAKAESERNARSQPSTSNWAKCRRISFAADGVPVMIRPSGDWASTSVASAGKPLPKTTTTVSAKVTLTLPFVGEVVMEAMVTSVEDVWDRDGDCYVTNRVEFTLPTKQEVKITSEGSLYFYSKYVDSCTRSAKAMIGEDDICFCGNRRCGGSTLAPIYDLKDLAVS